MNDDADDGSIYVKVDPTPDHQYESQRLADLERTYRARGDNRRASNASRDLTAHSATAPTRAMSDEQRLGNRARQLAAEINQLKETRKVALEYYNNRQAGELLNEIVNKTRELQRTVEAQRSARSADEYVTSSAVFYGSQR